MDWTARQLRAVVAVADRGNISHAAVELDLSQPTVSRMVSRIEDELGQPLFDRDTRGVTTTEAGARFVARAQAALRELDEISDELRSLEGRLVGKICVAMPDTIAHTLLIPLIDRFAAEHPAVELRVMTLHPTGVPLALQAGDADVGIVSSAHKSGGVVTRPLANEELHLVGAADDPALVSDEPIPLDEVADLPLVLPAIQPGLRNLIDAAFGSRQLRPNVELEIDAEDALVELMSSGRAHSITSFAGVQRFVARRQLAARRIADPSIDRVLSTALPGNRNATRLMNAVVEAIHELADELADVARWDPVP